jgi:hypothetical protein
MTLMKTTRSTSRLQALARILSVAAVVLFVAAPVFSQGQRLTPEERKARFDAEFLQLTSLLALDDATAPKVKEILWSQQETMMETMAAVQGSGGNQMARQGMRQKMQEVNAATREQLSTVLSDEQLEKYDAFQAERRRGPGQGQGQRGRRNLPQ